MEHRPTKYLKFLFYYISNYTKYSLWSGGEEGIVRFVLFNEYLCLMKTYLIITEIIQSMF